MSTEHSSSHSRHRTSRDTMSSSVPYIPQPENLPLLGGAVGEEAAELLIDLVHHRHHEGEETLIGIEDGHPQAGGDNECTSDNDDESHKRQNQPWWKRPSPWWLLVMLPVSAMAMSATLAPRIEIYTMLACSVHKPDIFKQAFIGVDLGSFGFPYDDTQNSLLPPLMANSSAPFDITLDWVDLTNDNSKMGLQNDTDKGPKKPNLCASDPVVQAAVAKLTAVMSASMGILSCLTTAWWGSFSDRHGRTRVLGISMIGLLLTDFNFIFVSLFSRRIPGGYWFLIVGPLIEGCVGGLSSVVAAMHAYMADTTNAETRSRIFSLSLGLIFAGMAIGPTLGGLVIRYTHQILSVFYVATVSHLIYAIVVWFVVPESLTQTQMHRSDVKYGKELRDTARNREMNPAVGLLVRIKRLFAFLSPLAVFMPKIVANRTHPLKKTTRDWSLTLIAAAYGFAISIMGSLTYKFQYASSTFGWTSETIGYWLSLVGAARAVYLTLVLPVTIKFFKPKSVYIQLPIEPTEAQPLLPAVSATFNEESTSSTTQSNSSTPSPGPLTRQKEIHSPTFDLALARISLLIEIISYTFMGLAPTPLAFTIFGMLGAFGTGFSPALQSVALELYARRGGTESGRLFGALSVIQALCSQILGPAIFGLMYMKTVATFPRAIFFLSVGAITISSVLLSFVRLPKHAHETVEVDVEYQESNEQTLGREVTLVDIDADEGEEG